MNAKLAYLTSALADAADNLEFVQKALLYASRLPLGMRFQPPKSPRPADLLQVPPWLSQDEKRNARARYAAHLYYTKHLNFKEVGDKLGVSGSRAAQIVRRGESLNNSRNRHGEFLRQIG